MSDSVFFIIIGCVLAVFTYCVFLIGFLSLARRIKAKTLWKNSVLRCIGILVKDIFLNLNCIWKTILLFGIYMLIHWGAVIRYIGGFSGWALFMAAADAAAFVYLIYKAIGRSRLKDGVKKISCGELGYEISL